ncbi:MAG TPA: acyl carrier protein [Candidatus Eisenbacteria bacterium]|nr:acyl carrier protein [Candidatus Eisenbacteria bacterium]
MTPKIKDALRIWIAKKNGKLAPEAIADDTPILEQRLLSSLHVPELILYVEQLSGRPISVGQLKPGVFRSIDTIAANFFSEIV